MPNRRRYAIAQEWLTIMQPYRKKRNKERSLKPSIIPLAVFILAWILLIGLQLFRVQIVGGSRYRELANGNRLRERVIYAPRGRIFDRNGQVLAENTVTSQLIFYPYLYNGDANQKAKQILAISQAINRSESLINQEVERLPANDIQSYVIAAKLDQPTIVKLEELLPSTPAFALEEIPSRRYNSDFGLSHLLGYTGIVTPENLSQDPSGKLLPTDRIGQAGVEASFDKQVRGTNGREKIEVDANARPISLIAKQPPQAGKDIRLTIDVALQRQLYESTLSYMQKANSKRAAGIVVDPNNGDVLAMVSLPSFDNNEFVDGISQTRYDQLLNDPAQPLLNKVISNGYATGSIIKPLVASAALQEGVVTPDTIIVDRGFIELQSQFDPTVRYRYNGWNQSGLGPMQVRSAIAYSSNIYFFTVGGGYQGQSGLGVDRLTSYYRSFGLGELSGINLPNEQPGLVPDQAWKKKVLNEDWFVGDTYNISIGQGDMSVSPLQITMAETVVANGGMLFRPRISLDEPVEHRRIVPVSAENLSIVREGMRQTVVRGTTPPVMFAKVPVKVAAKSGTAETNSPGGRAPHSWYTSFAPYEKPEIHATVLIEEGKEGISFSAPAIADVFANYFKGRQP